MDKFQNKASVVINLDELSATEIPEEIGHLTGATDLTIQLTEPNRNWTVYPPLSWFETRELKEPFRKLPESIGQLKRLRSLQLSNLDINKLPETITELSNLEHLDLSMNKLDISSELPKLRKLPRLKHLRVLGNHFDEQEMQEFKRGHPNLTVEYKDETYSNGTLNPPH